jgi:hypothetical protein
MATNDRGDGARMAEMATFITANQAILPFTEDFVGFSTRPIGERTSISSVERRLLLPGPVPGGSRFAEQGQAPREEAGATAERARRVAAAIPPLRESQRRTVRTATGSCWVNPFWSSLLRQVRKMVSPDRQLALKFSWQNQRLRF